MAIHAFGDLEQHRLESELEEGVMAIVFEHARHGYISYRRSYECELDLRAYIENSFDPLMRRHAYGTVLQRTFAFERILQRIPIDDSNYFFRAMVDVIDDYWRDLLEVGDPAVDQALLERLRDLVLSDGTDDDDADILWYLQESAGTSPTWTNINSRWQSAIPRSSSGATSIS